MFGVINRRPNLIEWIVILILIFFALRQMMSFPVTDDPDPDGYVSYASYLQEHWTIPSRHHRLPGYPLFISLVDLIGSGNMHTDVYWAQMFLCTVLLIAMSLVIRYYFGSLVAFVFLALFAAPNFFLRLSVVMLSDFLMQVLWLVYLLILVFYLRRTTRVINWIAIALLGVTTFSIYIVHPASRYLILLLLLSMGFFSFLFRRSNLPKNRLLKFNRSLIYKLGLAVLLVVMLANIANFVFDRGNKDFYRQGLAIRVCVCLPPVTNTPIDRQIENVKNQISADLGYRIEYERPQWNPKFSQVESWSEEIWKGRLRRYPLRFVGCVLNEIKLRHYIILNQFFPFDSERRFMTHVYLPPTNSPRANLYRLTGIELQDLPDNTPVYMLFLPICLAILKIAVFYGLIALGLVILFVRFQEIPLAMALTAIFWICFIPISVSLEPRLLNPFAPFLYLVDAVAIVYLVRKLLKLISHKLPKISLN